MRKHSTHMERAPAALLFSPETLNPYNKITTQALSCFGESGGVLEEPRILTLPSTDAWTRRWVESKHKPDYGRFVLTAGKFYGDAEKDKGELGTGDR